MCTFHHNRKSPTRQEEDAPQDAGVASDAGGGVDLTNDEVDYGDEERDEGAPIMKEGEAATEEKEEASVPRVGANPDVPSPSGGVKPAQGPPSKKSKCGDIPSRQSPSPMVDSPSPSPEPKRRMYLPVTKKPSPPPLPESVGVEPGTTTKPSPPPLPKTVGANPGPKRGTHAGSQATAPAEARTNPSRC